MAAIKKQACSRPSRVNGPKASSKRNRISAGKIFTGYTKHLRETATPPSS